MKVTNENTIMNGQKEITYFNEVLRKGVHLLSLGIPVIYSFVEKQTCLMLLVPLTVVFVTADVLSHRSGLVRDLAMKYFGGIMRSHELRRDKFMLNGASYVLLSACLCVLVFPKIIAITSFTILIVSDICAALVGRKFGRHKFLDKSLEGTLAFIVSALIVVSVIGSISNSPMSFYATASIAAVIGGIVENVSIRLGLDDNFSIPTSIGITMWVLATTLFSQQESYISLLR